MYGRGTVPPNAARSLLEVVLDFGSRHLLLVFAATHLHSHDIQANHGDRQPPRRTHQIQGTAAQPNLDQAPAGSGILDAGTTRVDLAVPAFEDPPVGSRVAQVAGPLNQGVVRLDHFERVCACVGDRHLGRGCLLITFAEGRLAGICRRWAEAVELQRSG